MSLTAAVATLPVGWLTDRVPRLSSLALAGVLLLRAARTYGSDAAGALESETRMAQPA